MLRTACTLCVSYLVDLRGGQFLYVTFDLSRQGTVGGGKDGELGLCMSRQVWAGWAAKVVVSVVN